MWDVGYVGIFLCFCTLFKKALWDMLDFAGFLHIYQNSLEYSLGCSPARGPSMWDMWDMWDFSVFLHTFQKGSVGYVGFFGVFAYLSK